MDYINTNEPMSSFGIQKRNHLQMKTTLIAAAVCGLFATQVSALDLSFGTDVSVLSTEGVETSSSEFSVDSKHDLGGFTVIAGATYDVIATDLTDFYVGAIVGNTTLSYGEQDGVFDFTGGLTKISGNVLADPAATDRTFVVSGLAYSASVGLNDGDVENVQATYAVPTFNGIDSRVGIDYNTTTEDVTLGVAANTKVGNGVVLGGVLTYADDYAVELNGSYKNASAFVTFDDEGADVLGVGYTHNVSKNADLFAEAGYDFNTEDTTVALGAALRF